MLKYLSPLLLLLIGCGIPKPKEVKYTYVTVDESCDFEYFLTLQDALSIWDYALDDSYSLEFGLHSQNKIFCNKEWTLNKSHVQASALIYFTDGIIIKFEIFFNEFNYKFSDSPNKNQVNMLNIMAHEIGHGLGIQHVTQKGCMMYKSEALGMPNKVLCEEEIDLLNSLYK